MAALKKWTRKRMARKRIVEKGVNSKGNVYTIYTDGSYRYDNSDGFHYKNSDGIFSIFAFSKCLKIKIKVALTPEEAMMNTTRHQMAEMGGFEPTIEK